MSHSVNMIDLNDLVDFNLQIDLTVLLFVNCFYKWFCVHTYLNLWV